MKSAEYRRELRSLTEWEPFLLKNSGLPGPRGNIELGQAVADEGKRQIFLRFIAFDATRAPVNTPKEFLSFCGTLGFGKLLAEGEQDAWRILRKQASDPRWRTREAVAMALQRFGDKDMDALLKAMRRWSKGSLLEQRAAVAALCEPRLLTSKKQVLSVLKILDVVTKSIVEAHDRKSDEFSALKKGLAYGWSVAVAASPDEGKVLMEEWFATRDQDVRWIMQENLKKNRLARIDAQWAKRWQTKLMRERVQRKT